MLNFNSNFSRGKIATASYFYITNNQTNNICCFGNILGGDANGWTPPVSSTSFKFVEDF
jgi:hypothetical protein